MSEEPFTLPAGPSDLCFETREFVKETFLVDEFLHTHRNAGSLEQMRDDLGLYLKDLRSAMIELINRDYQDFVNLSADLVDLDRKIEGIQKPVLALREEIVQVRGALTDTMDEISGALQAKRDILHSEKKACETEEGLKVVGRVKEQLQEEESSSLQLIERMALNIVHVSRMLKHFGVEGSDRRETQDTERLLLEALNSKFLGSLEEKDSKTLEKSLKIYVLLDQSKEAEEVFRTKVVVPRMQTLISESSLQNSPRGVNGIYDLIIEFVQTEMAELLKTAKSHRSFDFLYRSFWCEVERRLELHMSSIFAPGNPDLFHQKFLSTIDFLERIEAFSGGQSRLQETKEYRSFLAKWNLPVYFQIRFQEIGAVLETACSRDINKGLISEGDLRLGPFQTTLTCIGKSWSEGVFLPQLFGKFLKLTLQFLSRLGTWIDHAVEVKLDDPELPKASFLMILYTDIVNFEAQFSHILATVLKNMPRGLSVNEAAIRTCFDQSRAGLLQRLDGIQGRIADDLVTNSAPYIKQVNDIPRLYRKTNREMPTKNCAYVDHTLGAAREFHKKHVGDIGDEKCAAFLSKVFETLTEQYHAAVTEVLTSVQKTEESLRRLKNLRGAATSEPRTGVSDDDKIRLQLQVDVLSWAKAVEDEFKVKRPEVLGRLIQLVEDATKIQVEEKQ